MSTTSTFDPHPAAQPIPSAANERRFFDDLPAPVLDGDERGVIIRANAAAQELVHTHGIDFLGKEIWTLVAPDQVQISREAYFATIADPLTPPAMIRRSIYTPNGGYRTYQISRSFLHTPDGRVAGLRMVLMDVTEFALEHDRERTARLWLESVSDSLAEAVIVTDALGFIRFANPAATQLTGWEPHELLRMTVAKAIPILSYSRVDAVPFHYRLVLERRSSGIITFLKKDKQQATMAFNTAPVLDKIEGSTIGVSYVFHTPDL